MGAFDRGSLVARRVLAGGVGCSAILVCTLLRTALTESVAVNGIRAGQLSLGSIWKDTATSHEVTLRYPQDAGLDLKSVSICGGNSYVSRIRGAQALHRVSLALDLGRSEGKSLNATRPIYRPLRAEFGGPLGGTYPPRAWLVSAVPRPLLTISPRQIELGELVQGVTSWHMAEVGAEIALEGLTVSGSVEARITPRTSRRFLLETIVRGEQPGPFQHCLHLHPVGVDGRQLPTVAVTVTGTILSEFVTTPTRIAGGVAEIGSRISNIVTLRSRTGQPFHVERLSASTANIHVVRLRESDARVQFEVTQVVRNIGPQWSHLRLDVRNHETGFLRTVRISVGHLGLRNSDRTDSPKADR